MNDSERRLETLQAKDIKAEIGNTKYSAFIKKAQLILPIVAIIIVAMIFLWSSMTQKTIKLAEETTLSVDAIGMNELINPKFESRDDKNRPYVITADKAIQNRQNEDLVILENPSGEMSLTDSELIAISAQNGVFRQDDQKLVLKGSVKVAHSEGPTLDTEELHINIKEQESWSDTDVFLRGREGTLDAKGMRSYQSENRVKFIGPGKMILTNLGDQKLFTPAPQPTQQDE